MPLKVRGVVFRRESYRGYFKYFSIKVEEYRVGGGWSIYLTHASKITTTFRGRYKVGRPYPTAAKAMRVSISICKRIYREDKEKKVT